MEYCQAHGCEYATASPHQLCARHIAMLPQEMRDRLRTEYEVRQGNSTPYLIARLKAIRWLNDRLRQGSASVSDMG